MRLYRHASPGGPALSIDVDTICAAVTPAAFRQVLADGHPDSEAALQSLQAAAIDPASREALGGPLRLATVRRRAQTIGLSETVLVTALESLLALLRPRNVLGAHVHRARTWQLVELLLRAAEQHTRQLAAQSPSDDNAAPGSRRMAGPLMADGLLTVSLAFGASLEASEWAALLPSNVVPELFRRRLAAAFAELHGRVARLPALCTTSLRALLVPPSHVPNGFAIATLSARTGDRVAQCRLSHALLARVGGIVRDLLHQGRDVLPAHGAATHGPLGGEGAVSLAVYDRPMARQQLERACAPLLADMRQLAAALPSDSAISVELTWSLPPPPPPPAAAVGTATVPTGRSHWPLSRAERRVRWPYERGHHEGEQGHGDADKVAGAAPTSPTGLRRTVSLPADVQAAVVVASQPSEAAEDVASAGPGAAPLVPFRSRTS